MVERDADETGLIRIDRRTFLGGTSALVFGLVLAGRTRGALAAPQDSLAEYAAGDATPSLFISIEDDGTVKLTCHRSEMGQQVWNSMAQILADELDADWDRIEIVQAIGHPRYGDQNTDGSRSVRRNFERLRMAGAAMRLLLERAAAKKWRVPPSACKAELGYVVHTRSKRRLGYGELARVAADLPLPRANDVVLKKRSQWRYIDKSVASLTVPAIVHGDGTFGIDVHLPGMLYAVIQHPPCILDKVRSFDDSNAMKMPGVIKTVQLPDPEPPAGFQPLGGVAVVGKNTWAAIQGREALRIAWDRGPNHVYDSEAFADTLRETARQPGQVRRKRGDVSTALETADKRIQAEYYVPHLAHSPMEPPAAVARWSGDAVECWACVQAPQSARKAVAAVCKVPEDKVTIHVTWLGGGFGRKSKPDFVAEAALIAREVGAPVKLIWTREDDLQHSYYHTVSVQRLEGALAEDGTCTAFLHRTVFPPIRSTFVDGATEPTWGDLRLGASDNPFAVPNLQLETGEAPAHVRIGWLRSVANIYHAFAIQSFAAELAHAAGRDQKDYLLELIGPPRHVDPTIEGAEYDNYGSDLSEYPIDTGRLAHVTRRAADLAGWGRKLPKGHGLGIAAHRSFLSYVATVIEVAVDSEGHIAIPGVWSVMDAGTVVNPNHVESQLEGGTLFGLSNALYGEITANGGIIEQANFPDWRLMRMNEAPRQIRVELIKSTAPPGGVGEPPTPPAAPALANAIFAATGLRIRRLPIFGNSRIDRLTSDDDKKRPARRGHSRPETNSHPVPKTAIHSLRVNGEDHAVECAVGTPLLWVLRDQLGLTGSKYGCGVAQCGACTVHVDGQPRRSCVAPVESLTGKSITTIEKLTGAEADAVRAAWEKLQVPQCGYCQSGQIMSAVALLTRRPSPNDIDIDRGMSGNICRCATYMRIRRAIKNAAGQG